MRVRGSTKTLLDSMGNVSSTTEKKNSGKCQSVGMILQGGPGAIFRPEHIH